MKIANGQLMGCTSVTRDYQFTLQGHSFAHDLHILQLNSYDLILGMDCLERFSPMEIHWKAKWITLPYDGHQLVLHGLSTTKAPEMVS